MDSAALAEERASELEALESIYADDFRLLSVDDDGGGASGESSSLASFEIDIRSREVPTGPNGALETAACCLHFEYTPDYPNQAPTFAVLDSQNLTDSDLDSLQSLMETTCEESLGCVMIFSVVSAVQEALQDVAERLEETRRHAEEARQRQLEEEERRKVVGTPVTPETFGEWRRRFDAEMAVAKAAKAKATGVVAGGGGAKKPTGKELFLADNRFDVSDLQILQEEGGEAVEVDESLFQSLDDLDLEGEVE
ncbi:hypothetical protein BOX15_Mlig009399g2 [Macrostomum lignano]|uniref:RWD domain-containing protein n=2 Tax=Macrostomum lignano TaxID=282301 RepID=A0A1I8IZ42_9PLAT|nr:hypothetical protein BOX15_Mlig009399g2 [Macrostomum lignano]